MPQLSASLETANAAVEKHGFSLVLTNEASFCMQRTEGFLGEGVPVLFPICLNNGYYNAEKIRAMMAYLPCFCEESVIFFTDGPARNNYLAIGKTQVEAEREARLQRNRLHNHCLAGLEDASLGKTFSARFDDWQEIYKDPIYQESYEKVRILYSESPVLREDVERDTVRVLGRISHEGKPPGEQAIAIAASYVLEELAYILSSPSRLAMPKLVYIYYDRWSVLEKLLDGIYDGIVRDDIAYLMLTLKKSET